MGKPGPKGLHEKIQEGVQTRRSRSRSKTLTLVSNVNKSEKQMNKTTKRKIKSPAKACDKVRRIILKKGHNNNAVPSSAKGAKGTKAAIENKDKMVEEDKDESDHPGVVNPVLNDGVDLFIEGPDFLSDWENEDDDGRESGSISEEEVDTGPDEPIVDESEPSTSTGGGRRQGNDDYQDALLNQLLSKKLKSMTKTELEQLMREKGEDGDDILDKTVNTLTSQTTPKATGGEPNTPTTHKLIKSPSDTTL